MATLIRKRPLETSPPPEGRPDLPRSRIRSSKRHHHTETTEYVNKRVKRRNSVKLRRVPSVRRRQLRTVSSQDRGQLNILINQEESDISINIIQARKLMSSDRRVCNPYVKVLLRNDEKVEKVCVGKKTKPVHNNRNPKFKEKFTFALRETPQNGRIIISVFNRVGTRNEFLGCMSFGIQNMLANHKEVSGWYYLLDHDLGRRKHQPAAIQRPRSQLASSSKMKPKFLTIERGDHGRYGFTLLDSLPVRVNTIVPGGPAEKVGLECNDLFLELNGFNVVGSSCKAIVELIAQAPGKLRLLVQPYANIRKKLLTLSTQTLSVTPAISVRRLTMTPAPSCTAKHSTSVRRALQEVDLSSVLTDENSSHPSSSNSSVAKLRPSTKKPLPIAPSNSCFVKPMPVDKISLPCKPSTSVHPFHSNADGPAKMTLSLEDSFNPAIDAHQSQIRLFNEVTTSKQQRPMMLSSPGGEPTSYDCVSCMSPDSMDGHCDSLLSDSSFISTSSLSDDSEVKDGSMYEALLLEKLEVTGVAEIASVFSLPFFQRNSPVVPTPKPKPEKPKVPEKPKIPEKLKPTIPEKPNILEKPKPKIPDKPKHLVKQHSARIFCGKDAGKASIPRENDPWQKISTICPDTSSKRKRNDLGENLMSESKKICHFTNDPSLMTPKIKQREKNIPSHEIPSMDNIMACKLSVGFDVKPVLPELRIESSTGVRDFQSSATFPEESLLSDSSATTVVNDRSLSKTDGILGENDAVYIVDMPCAANKDDKEDDNKESLSLGDAKVCDDGDVSGMSGELGKNKEQSGKQTIMLGGIKREVIFTKKVEPFIVDVPGRDFIHAGKLFLRKKVNKIQEVFGILFCDMLIFTKLVLSSNKIKVIQPPVMFSQVSVMDFITKRANEFHIFMVTSDHPATFKANKIVLGAPTSRLKKVWQFLLQHYILEVKISALKDNGVQHLHTDIEIDGAAMESNNNRAGLLDPQLMLPSSSKSNNGGILTNTSKTDMVHSSETANESGTHSNTLSSTNCCEWDSATPVNPSSPALRSNRSFPYLRNAVISSAPNSPINKVTANSHTLLERQQSSPMNIMLTDENSGKKGKRKTSIFKRFSGKNKDEVSGKGSKEKASKKDSKEKNHESRRAMSVGDERMLHGVDNNIPTLEEGEELAGQSFQRHSVSDKPVRKSSRNLAKDLKDKVRSLRRRHTDSALRDAEKLQPPLPPCTLTEVRQWSESFDRLLRDKCGLEAFRRFLQTEFSDENIEFWLACEEYRTLSPSKHTNRARKIHEDYVATQAPREVNLDSTTRIETTSNVGKPDEHTFDNAQKRIEALMEKDSYPRFLKSDIYQQLLRTSKKSEC